MILYIYATGGITSQSDTLTAPLGEPTRPWVCDTTRVLVVIK